MVLTFTSLMSHQLKTPSPFVNARVSGKISRLGIQGCLATGAPVLVEESKGRR